MTLTLFLIFLKIGFLSFGGGYAMLSLIYDEAAVFGMTAAEFADLNALDVLVPGPIAINSATYVGQLYASFPGALAATVAVCIPSLVIVPLYMRFEQRIKDNKYLSSALSYVKSASAGLIFAVALSIMFSTTLNISGISELKNIKVDWPSFAIMTAAFAVHIKFDVNPIILTLIAAVIGGAIYYI